jgi:hypothetical protein
MSDIEINKLKNQIAKIMEKSPPGWGNWGRNKSLDFKDAISLSRRSIASIRIGEEKLMEVKRKLEFFYL